MMGGSGLILLFAVQVAHILPGEIVPLAHTIHSDEAMLAVSWIAIVHMFNAHLAPGIFPFNPAIFTGKLRKDRYEHEHPLEFARMITKGDGKSEAMTPGPLDHDAEPKPGSGGG